MGASLRIDHLVNRCHALAGKGKFCQSLLSSDVGCEERRAVIVSTKHERRRFGPAWADRDGLCIGDPDRNRLVLTSRRVEHRNTLGVTASWQWSDLDAIDLVLPSTRFRFPEAVSYAAYTALVAVIWDVPDLVPDDASANVRARGEAAQRVDIGRTHFGGYWQRSIETVQGLVDHLIAYEEPRALLDSPHEVLLRLARTARSR